MLRVVISCQHMDLSPALREHTETKVHKACANLDAPPPNCHVFLTLDKPTHKAEMRLHHLGHDFSARAENMDDMYVAIDTAANRLRRQLKEFINKNQSYR